MAGFNDPNVITQDYSAYTFAALLCGLESPNTFVSGDGQVVAHPRRTLHVCSLNGTES